VTANDKAFVFVVVYSETSPEFTVPPYLPDFKIIPAELVLSIHL